MAQTPPKIPGFSVQSLLGRGGFADVYLYRQKRPERKVAVKVLRELGSREGRQVFTTEADALAATCAHPAILSLYQTGKLPDGRPYLVLQYCPVTNLSQRVRRSPLPLKEALDITIRLAGALETIHRAGLAHRDMKPANVLISEFSTPVLSDFGLALPLGKPLAHRDVLGLSVPWAPPEQHDENSLAGAASDIYSLAATMHSLVTGRSPFEIPGGDNSVSALTERILHTAPRLDAPQLIPPLREILVWALQPDPADRPASAAQFGQVLQEVQAQLNQPVTSMDIASANPTLAQVSTDPDATRLKDASGSQPALDSADAARADSPLIVGGHSSVALSRSLLPASRLGWRRILLALIGAFVLVAGTGAGVAYYFKSDTSSVKSAPSSSEPLITASADDGIVTEVSAVTALEGKPAADGQIALTWKPGEGDTPASYQVQVTQDGKDAGSHTVTEPKISLKPQGGKWCVKVFAVSIDGKTSPGVDWCK
ncbi:serine/threonine-protein kinase [Varibaculum prostatecancerukia]|uniref:serine/threonine-protein kinase n=1 Tax=Varibaculum prostatecancerukia TaxID=2811781 RepID=UPI001C0073FA|nr:serine/threonine-protein kinase [Varibaculum prostatecancerukia]